MNREGSDYPVASRKGAEIPFINLTKGSLACALTEAEGERRDGSASEGPTTATHRFALGGRIALLGLCGACPAHPPQLGNTRDQERVVIHSPSNHYDGGGCWRGGKEIVEAIRRVVAVVVAVVSVVSSCK
jgi:hypothetical protein